MGLKYTYLSAKKAGGACKSCLDSSKMTYSFALRWLLGIVSPPKFKSNLKAD